MCTFAMPAGTVFDWHVHDGPSTRVGVERRAHRAQRRRGVGAAADAGALDSRGRAPRDAVRRRRDDANRLRATEFLFDRVDDVHAGRCVAARRRAAGSLGATVTWTPRRRTHAELLLVDLLEPVPTISFEVRMPTDDRALRVAEMLIDNPADDRTLAAWGVDVGASSRTLARAFIAETGLPFARWRALVRLQRAMEALGSDEPVTEVARHVGYESASAFVAAFRRETGITPARYFHEQRSDGKESVT